MKISSTVTVRYVEIDTDEEYLAWRAGLAMLLTVLERYHRQQAVQAAEISLQQPALAG